MTTDSPEVLQRVRDGLIMVNEIARRLSQTLGRTSSTDHDEFVSAGQTGLLHAARRYDPALGASFRTFARHHIEGAMIDVHRKHASLPRRAYEHFTGSGPGAPESANAEGRERLAAKHVAGIATAQATGLLKRLGVDTQGDFVAISSITTAEEASQRRQHLELLQRCLQTLPPDEAVVVRRHDLDGEPLEHVADELGLTRSKARTLHERAHARLRKQLVREIGR